MAESRKRKRTVREFSAGGAVFRKDNGHLSWLIIKPTGTNRWQLPKGQIEKEESSEKAALREVKEEGGVKTRLIEKIGNIQYFFTLKGKRIFKTVVFYLMEYLGKTPKGHDWEVEKAIFLPFEKAIEKLTFKNDKEILRKARALLRGAN